MNHDKVFVYIVNKMLLHFLLNTENELYMLKLCGIDTVMYSTSKANELGKLYPFLHSRHQLQERGKQNYYILLYMEGSFPRTERKNR